jgi:membrane-bound lytic murein transglycosylase B
MHPLSRGGLVALAVLVGLTACSSKETAAPRATTTTSAPAPSTTSSTQAPTTTTTVPAGPPVAARDAAGLAAQITAAESAIRNPAVAGPALARAGWEQQVAYRALAGDPGRVTSVAAAVPSDLRATVEANAKAGAELFALTKPRTALPDNWRIVAPAPYDELVADYKAAERELGVPWNYLAAIHFVETKLGRIRGTSTAGAQGPMQFLPRTWQAYGGGGDINNNRDAIFGAARLLKANGAPTRMDNALFQYNHSDHYVQAIKLYAEQMGADEKAFRGYYGWQVYYRMVGGDRVLLEGYPDVPAAPA